MDATMRSAALAALLLVLGGCAVQPMPADPVAVGIVVASHPDAVAAGLEVLRQGGNAMDAAAAVQFALNVAEPMMSGIGGGAFILYWDHAQRALVALDGREVAPAAATPDMFQATDGLAASERGIAVGVPGTLALWDEALRRHGTWSLAQALAPGTALAGQGVTVDEVTSAYIAASIDKLRRWPAAAQVFLDGAVCPPQQASQVVVADHVAAIPCEGGSALLPGAILRQPALAMAFDAIAAQGPAAFYEGPLGEAVVAAQAARGGRMTMDDLAAYEVAEREPLVRPWRGYEVATLGLPSGGPVLQEALAILEPMATHPRAKPEAAHLAVEALHLAFADRAAYLGDPATARATPEQLLAPAFVDARRALIDPERSGAPFAPGPVADARPAEAMALPAGLHTTHFTVIDRHGDIVAATSTIESVFGSGIMVPEYGFFLNNEMTDFDLAPGGPNEVGPGKRPLSSMTPTIVFRGDPVLALGSPGGSTIIGTVLQVMLDVLGGTPLQDAVDAPRWAAGLSTELRYEQAWDPPFVQAMAARGHDTVPVGAIGGVHAIHWEGEWVGAADPRRAGTVGSL